MEGFLKCLRKSIKDNTREILMKAEKVIFAEKIVDFMMVKHHGVPYQTNIHHSYRTAVQNHFDESIKNTLDEMDDILKYELEEILQILKSANGLDLEHYIQYGVDLYEGYFENTFEARKFLYFCVHMARLAVGFYREGVRTAPDFGLNGILYGLKFWDMHRGRWESLKLVAGTYNPSPKSIALKERYRTVCEGAPEIEYSDRDLPTESEELDSSTSSNGIFKLFRAKKRPFVATKEETDSSSEDSTDTEDDEYDLLYRDFNRVLVSPVSGSCSSFQFTSDGSEASSAPQQSSAHLPEQSGLSSASSLNDSKMTLESFKTDHRYRLKKARRRLF